MKVFVLAGRLNTRDGWGRYSENMLKAFEYTDVEVVVASGASLPEPMNYRKNYFLAFWYAWKLRKQAKNCDILHSLVEPYSWIVCLLSFLTGKKYLITAHGTYGVLPYHQSFWRSFFHKQSFSRASKIICVSSYTKKVLSKFGLKNLHIINNGINFNKFYQPPPPVFGKRDNIILTVGALKHRKGQHVSLEAFAKISSEFKDVKYYIVGSQDDTIYFDRLKQLVLNLNLENKVEFFPSILGDEALIEKYRQAKILVLTSLNTTHHFEGFGLVYLEANACGTPVIGSYNSGAEDAVQNEKTGLLVLQNKPEQIAGAMSKLFQDNNLWQSMSKEGVVWARKHDWKEIIQEYVKVYKYL